MSTTMNIGGLCLKCGQPNISHAGGVCPFWPKQSTSTMQPTMNFRWLDREVTINDDIFSREKVLQQGWAPTCGGHVEWRDVPTVMEETGR